jgi:hypothetical protein
VVLLCYVPRVMRARSAMCSENCLLPAVHNRSPAVACFLLSPQVTGQLAPVYDGSWSEWAAVPGAPIVKDEPGAQ